MNCSTGRRRRRLSGVIVLLAIAVFGAPGAATAADPKRITVRVEVCPASVQDPPDYDPAHQPNPCTLAAAVGTVDPPPDGFTYDPEPLLFDLQIQIDGLDGVHEMGTAEVVESGTCDPATFLCTIGRSYRWMVASGPVTVTALTVPPGYRFGWAVGDADIESVDIHPDVDVSARRVSFDQDEWGGGVTIRIANFLTAAVAPTPPPTLPPTSTGPTAAAAAGGSSESAVGLLVALVAAAGLVAGLVAGLRPRRRLLTRRP